MFRLLTFSISFALLCAAPAHAAAQSSPDSEAKALQAFRRDIQNTPKRPRTPDQRLASLTTVDAFDSAATAEAMVFAYCAVEAELETLSAERVALMTELSTLERKHGRKNAKEIAKELMPKLQAKRSEIDDIHPVMTALRGRIERLETPESKRWLIANVLTNKRYSLLLKLAVAKVAGSITPEILDQITRVLGKAKRGADIVAVLDALAAAGPQARTIAPKVIALLAHNEQQVRERAALALSQIAVPEAIEPMIDLIEQETGHTKKTVAAALEAMTRQKHGTLVSTWRTWFQHEKARLMSGEIPLGGGVFDLGRDSVDVGYYFDIAMDGKSIMYIIDASGSMKADVTLKTQSSTGEPETKSRLEACKAELIAALGRLAADAEFNIIWYNVLPHLFQERMVPASEDWTNQGAAMVRDLKPNKTTNIYDSLRLAFDVAGRGSKDKYYGIELDTIFLLTDGSPTRPDNTRDSTQKIIEAVREWNVLKRVRIHTIGIGDKVNRKFMAQLAAENNGEFRQF